MTMLTHAHSQKHASAKGQRGSGCLSLQPPPCTVFQLLPGFRPMCISVSGPPLYSSVAGWATVTPQNPDSVYLLPRIPATSSRVPSWHGVFYPVLSPAHARKYTGWRREQASPVRSSFQGDHNHPHGNQLQASLENIKTYFSGLPKKWLISVIVEHVYSWPNTSMLGLISNLNVCIQDTHLKAFGNMMYMLQSGNSSNIQQK